MRLTNISNWSHWSHQSGIFQLKMMKTDFGDGTKTGRMVKAQITEKRLEEQAQTTDRNRRHQYRDKARRTRPALISNSLAKISQQRLQTTPLLFTPTHSEPQVPWESIRSLTHACLWGAGKREDPLLPL